MVMKLFKITAFKMLKYINTHTFSSFLYFLYPP